MRWISCSLAVGKSSPCPHAIAIPLIPLCDIILEEWFTNCPPAPAKVMGVFDFINIRRPVYGTDHSSWPFAEQSYPIDY
ncbi:hypothetical protein D1872_290890 [compost metagenome]